jgi:hypothetical protein
MAVRTVLYLFYSVREQAAAFSMCVLTQHLWHEANSKLG